MWASCAASPADDGGFLTGFDFLTVFDAWASYESKQRGTSTGSTPPSQASPVRDGRGVSRPGGEELLVAIGPKELAAVEALKQGVAHPWAGQPPCPALPTGPTVTEVPEPSVTGRLAAPGQLRVTDLVSFGGVTTRPVMRTPEPPDLLNG